MTVSRFASMSAEDLGVSQKNILSRARSSSAPVEDGKPVVVPGVSAPGHSAGDVPVDVEKLR